MFREKQYSAESIWKWRKTQDDLSENTIKIVDKLMDLVGLEEVKTQVLDIMNKVEVAKHQAINLKEERLNIIFQGNPGTGKRLLYNPTQSSDTSNGGKTTVARIYAKFLQSVGVLDSSSFLEWSGAKMVTAGPVEVQKKLEDMLQGNIDSNIDDSVSDGSSSKCDAGGVVFIDEAYQLTVPHSLSSGRLILDILLTEMENNTGRLIMIFAGYKKDMQSFIEHNEGIRSRVLYTLHFDDFDDFELWAILRDKIKLRYKGQMKVEGKTWTAYICELLYVGSPRVVVREGLEMPDSSRIC